MTISMLQTALLATPFVGPWLELAGQALPLIRRLARLLQAFVASPATPARTQEFELALHAWLQQLGLLLVTWVYQHHEGDEADLPARLDFEGQSYRRRSPSQSRHGVATLFGMVRLCRVRYEPLETGLRCVFPLEIRLGVTAGWATPALAERVGQWAAQHPQETVLDLLRQEHNVCWSVSTLRHVTAAVSAGLASQRHEAQVARLLEWLTAANGSRGPHRPVLAVGRDGVFVPLRADREYHEAATATVSVLDRRGQRVSTVYLGHMPQAGQETLSERLTALLQDVLRGWQGPLPRLEYLTDGGHQPTAYFEVVLRRMEHPRTGARLAWEWVLDYYHACGYLAKLADALFGAGTQAAAAWSAKMRRWLRDKRRGAFRVLHAAAAQRQRWQLSAAEEEAYAKAYAYLRKRLALMDYADYRRRGLAIGSGVTEAGCKTLFTQRFKQAGMSWLLEGGQVIVELRSVWLSGVWPEAHAAYLAALPQPQGPTKAAPGGKTRKKAA